MPITNLDLVKQLEEIFQLATRNYPYPDDQPPLDGHLVFALGEVAGLTRKAISAYQASARKEG